MVQPQPQQFPLNIGSPAEFAEVRATLTNANFTEDVICKTLKIEEMCDVGGIDFRTIDFSNVSAQFRILFQLFFGQRPLNAAEVEGVLSASSVRAFKALGLLGSYGSDQLYGHVLLYPVAGFFIASDRHTNPDGTEFDAPADIVFPAIYGGTLRFLRLLPRADVDDSLDLCAGSGIGAFVLSRHSGRAVSSDVTQRATHFAAFNRALNSLENVDVVCGDLYGGVTGRKFDLIVAHPPYVPSLDNATIWRDGGITGELITRRVIEGLPEFLRPGGTACVVSLGVDNTEGQFEDRVRQWLGSSQNEFDIIFATTNERTPAEVLRDMAERNPEIAGHKLQTLSSAFTESGIVRMPHGALVLRRSAEKSHGSWSLRTRLSNETEGSDFERTFRLHPQLTDPDTVAGLSLKRPTLAPRLQVVATHVVYEGELVPAEFIFETDKPFEARGRIDRWMVPLLTRIDGKLTLAEIYDSARKAEELPEGFQLGDFTQLVARMIERGFFELPD